MADALAELDAARADLLAANAAVDALADQVDDLLDGIGILPADLTDQVADVKAQVDAAVAAVEDAEALLADALADAGLGDLLALLDPIQDLLDGLDLESLLSDLLDQIAGVPLLSLGSIDLALGTAADATSSLGSVTCAASGLEILGSAVPTPDCAAVGGALATLGGTLDQVLDPLLGAGALGVTAGGLVMESSGTGTPNADGVSSAFARISALTLDIDPLELDGIVDDLTGDLIAMLGDLDGLLGILDGLLAELDLDALLGELDLLETGLLADVAELDTLLSALDAVIADPDGVLGDVTDVLDGDLGGILDDLGGSVGILAVSDAPVQATALALPSESGSPGRTGPRCAGHAADRWSTGRARHPRPQRRARWRRVCLHVHGCRGPGDAGFAHGAGRPQAGRQPAGHRPRPPDPAAGGLRRPGRWLGHGRPREAVVDGPAAVVAAPHGWHPPLNPGREPPAARRRLPRVR